MTIPPGEPTQRALAAAEALDAEGVRVTARAVKDRARVQMETARAAAADWNTRKATQANPPAVPESLTVRFAAIWDEAWRTARAEFETERQGWISRLEEAERDVEALQADLITAEQQRDHTRTEMDALQAVLHDERTSHAETVQQLRQGHTDLEKTQIRIQATLEATTAERDRTRDDLAAERSDRAATETRHHQQVTDLEKAHAHTQATLEATTAERDRMRGELAAASTRTHEPTVNPITFEPPRP